MLRLDKYLADMGVGSRAQVKQQIRKGQVFVNGIAVKNPACKISPSSDEVRVNGTLISYQKFEYYMLHKPSGVVSATQDLKEKTVLDLIPTKKRKDLFPVGRLDKDTEGLLLITNDGALAHQLLSPKKHVEKRYFARIEGCVEDSDITAFSRGLLIGDESPTLPAKLKIIESAPVSLVEIAICEGRFHQIKRMFEAVGKKVLYLKRLSMGSLSLDEALPIGEYRPLTKEEIERLQNND